MSNDELAARNVAGRLDERGSGAMPGRLPLKDVRRRFGEGQHATNGDPADQPRDAVSARLRHKATARAIRITPIKECWPIPTAVISRRKMAATIA